MAGSKTTRSSSGDGTAFGLPAPATLRRLKISPEVAWFMVSRGIPFPEFPPLVKAPEPRMVKGAAFDPERVDKVLAAFSVLRHTQGDLAGQPLVPDPWQVAYIIAPVFGWVRKNEAGRWVRIIRSLYVDVPRKNGKSTLCGGFAIYLTAADGEAGAQVLAAATTSSQAGYVFAPVKQLASVAPALRGHVRALQNRIIHPRTNSYFGVVSSVAEALHGANVHGAIIDELHVHKTPDLVEAIETGTGSRSQPLVVKITTADDGRPNTIYARNRRYIEQLEKNVFKDPSTYGVVFAALESDDPFAELTWKKANPGYGVSPTKESLKEAAEKARNSPAELSAFLRLRLGIRTKQTTRFIDLKSWDRNAGHTKEEDLLGRGCYGGLDLGSVSDLTALCWLFPKPDRHGYDAIWRFWTPEDNLEALDKRTANAASLWVSQGWLDTTPGNVTDYDYIKERILADMDRFDVESIGYDRWNATQIVNDLMAEDVPLVKTGQGMFAMNPAMKEMQRLVLLGTRSAPVLEHGGNPIMRWMVDNLAVATDASGNVKPDKANSGDKIDGVSALANAISEALGTAQVRSAYEDSDLIIA
jgi:phage terminase large subunit-like protein